MNRISFIYVQTVYWKWGKILGKCKKRNFQNFEKLKKASTLWKWTHYWKKYSFRNASKHKWSFWAIKKIYVLPVIPNVYFSTSHFDTPYTPIGDYYQEPVLVTYKGHSTTLGNEVSKWMCSKAGFICSLSLKKPD